MNVATLLKTSGVAVSAFLLLTACALFQPWQVLYLKTAVNHATKEDVVRRMGPPRQISTLNGGGSLLLYQFKEFQAGDLNGPGRWWCEEYELLLDEKHVLRQWKEHDCSSWSERRGGS